MFVVSIRLLLDALFNLCQKLDGPYLASGAIDLITGAFVVASLQLAQSVLFPPAPRVGK